MKMPLCVYLICSRHNKSFISHGQVLEWEMKEEKTSNVELSLFYYILCRAELQSLNFPIPLVYMHVQFEAHSSIFG